MILLDTNAVIWVLSDSKRLSKNAKEAIREARSSFSGLAISSISLFEIAQLASRGRIAIAGPLDIALQDLEEKFTVVNVNARIAYLTTQFPEAFPRDPMDRMIAATALAEGIPLVTADEGIRKSKALRVIW